MTRFITTGKGKNRKVHPIRKKHGVSRYKRFDQSKIQSLIFNKRKFSISNAKKWADNHDFKSSKVDTERNTLRIRQFSPNKIKRGGECRTIQFGGSGVQGVLCEIPVRMKKDSKLSTSLGSIILPPKIAPKILIKQMNDDLDFRDSLIEKNNELKDEIKSDPQSEFAQASREEFKENAKEIRNLSKDIKKAFNQLPKESKKTLDRPLQNRLRVLR